MSEVVSTRSSIDSRHEKGRNLRGLDVGTNMATFLPLLNQASDDPSPILKHVLNPLSETLVNRRYFVGQVIHRAADPQSLQRPAVFSLVS
jgi:hypothetical protein